MEDRKLLYLTLRIEGKNTTLTFFPPDDDGNVRVELDSTDSDDPTWDEYTVNGAELVRTLQLLIGGE